MNEKLVGIEQGSFPDDKTGEMKFYTRLHILTEFEKEEMPENLVGSLVSTHTLMQNIQGLLLGPVSLNFAKVGAKVKLVSLKNIDKKAG